MALLNKRNITRLDKSRNRVHESVDVTYTSFLGSNGEKYLQIDTYGTDSREIKDKVSQSFQFDRATGEFLIELLKKELDLND